MILEHKPLHCPITGERFMNVFGQALPNHGQVKCKTSAGNELDIGISRTAIEKGITLDTLNAILEGIKIYWIYEIEINKNMSEAEKQKRIAFHNSHHITEVIQVIDTGAEAKEKAKDLLI